MPNWCGNDLTVSGPERAAQCMAGQGVSTTSAAATSSTPVPVHPGAASEYRVDDRLHRHRCGLRRRAHHRARGPELLVAGTVPRQRPVVAQDRDRGGERVPACNQRRLDRATGSLGHLQCWRVGRAAGGTRIGIVQTPKAWEDGQS
jgi:hypothetical protein